MCCLSEKFDPLLILKSRVLQSFKGCDAPKCGGLFLFVCFNLRELVYLALRLSRVFHNTSAKGLILGADAQNLRKVKHVLSY